MPPLAFTRLPDRKTLAALLAVVGTLSWRVECVCDVGLSMSDRGCALCHPGSYKDSVGSDRCTSCPYSKFSNLTGATSAQACNACPHYHFAEKGSKNFEACRPPSTVSLYIPTEQTICRAPDCLDDEDCGGAGRGVCIKGTCECNHRFRGRRCTICASGHAGVNCSEMCSLFGCNGHGRCRASGVCECAEGFTSTPNNSCIPCPMGTYSNRTGTLSCVGCGSNSNSPPASTAQTSCICNPGYSGPHGGKCEQCPTGTYKSTNGSMACSLCQAGSYSSLQGQISRATCLDCPSHSYSKEGSGDIENCACNAGFTVPADGSHCTLCIAGSYKDVWGSFPCTLCPAGKYSTSTGQISIETCKDCPGNAYSQEGSSNFTNCSCNLGYTGLDGYECTPCIAGKYKDISGSASCKMCSRGTYSGLTAQLQDNCTKCPNETSSPMGSTCLEMCICNAGYSGKDGKQCSPCPPGKTDKNACMK
jgi:hypothetical protein